jgi:hypothetical protein
LFPSEGKKNGNDNNAMTMREDTNEEIQPTENSSVQKMSFTEPLPTKNDSFERILVDKQ